MHLGHIGWGFETEPGVFCFGAKETVGSVAIWPGQNNGVFIETNDFERMLETMKRGKTFNYQQYKILDIDHTCPEAAKDMAEDSKNWGYSLVGNNCVDDAFKIIKAFSCGDDLVLPWPSTHPVPNKFFHHIPGEELVL